MAVLAAFNKEPLKDPKGGLTARGRKAYARKGHKLRPGVTRKGKDMSPTDMKRKGSWATRFYGRKVLPALKDKRGNPTRFAKTAAAWGEPIPTTKSAARRIAKKGRHLLERYKRTKEVK
jgi:hypothetical protein